MVYTPQTWVDGFGGGTPISAARLNYMESGISGAYSYLGKIEPSGVTFNGVDHFQTLYDPASASWNAGGWWSVLYQSGNQVDFMLGSGDTVDSLNQIRSYAYDTGTQFSAVTEWRAYDHNLGVGGVDMTAAVSINPSDGTVPTAHFGASLSNVGVGYWSLDLYQGGSQFALKADTNQADPLIILYDTADNPLLQVTPGVSGYSVGFQLQGPTFGADGSRWHRDFEGDDTARTAQDRLLLQPTAVGDPVSYQVDLGINPDATLAYTLLRVQDSEAMFEWASDRDTAAAKLTLKSHAGQTTPILDLQDSGAHSLFKIDANGIAEFGDGQVTLLADGSTVQLFMEAYAGQTSPVISVYSDSLGAQVFVLDPDGKIRTNQSATATGAVSGLAKKMPIYDVSGTLLGYIPIYSTIT